MLRKVNIDHFVCKIGLLKGYETISTKILNAVIPLRTMCAHRERAVNTLQKLLARRRSVIDGIKTPRERSEDAEGTL